MPHCLLEASANLLDQPDWAGLLREINGTLVATGLFKAEDIKSRFLSHGIFVIGDGAPDQAFVTLTVQILSGRPDEVKAELSEALLTVLGRSFPRTFAQMTCSLTVQITEPITARQLTILQVVAKHPDVARDHLVKAGATDADLAYLERHDLIRERAIGRYRVSHMGQEVLKRSL